MRAFAVLLSVEWPLVSFAVPLMACDVDCHFTSSLAVCVSSLLRFRSFAHFLKQGLLVFLLLSFKRLFLHFGCQPFVSFRAAPQLSAGLCFSVYLDCDARSALGQIIQLRKFLSLFA